MISKNSEQMFVSEAGTVKASGGRGSYDDRLNGILEAATGVIARVGYGRASMRAVAKAANVSLAGLYHYFDSKETMLFLIQFRTFGSLLSNLQEKLHGVDDPVEQLGVMIRAHIGYFASNMAALKVCSHELDALTGEGFEQTRRIRHEYYELTRSMVERACARSGAGGEIDHHVATMSLFGMLNWLYRWYAPGVERSPNGLAQQILRIFLNGIGGASMPSAPGS